VSPYKDADRIDHDEVTELGHTVRRLCQIQDWYIARLAAAWDEGYEAADYNASTVSTIRVANPYRGDDKLAHSADPPRKPLYRPAPNPAIELP
jgi:hypothetical protein